MTSVMTLVEGHGDYVMDAVGPSVVPSVAEIRAKFTARRGSGDRIEQAIRRILGIDLKMKQYEQGSRFVKAVVDEAGHGRPSTRSGPRRRRCRRWTRSAARTPGCERVDGGRAAAS